MARASKTVIGGGEGQQGERMTRAAASGADAVAQAHAQLMGEGRATQDRFARLGEVSAQLVGQGESRKLQSEGLDLEAAKAGFERTPEPSAQQPEAAGQTAKAQESSGGAPEGTETKTDQITGQQSSTIGALKPDAQQRLNAQVGEPMEQDRQGTWRKTVGQKQSEAREERRKDFAADTDRMRTLAYQDQTAQAAQKAYRTGDKKAFDEETETLSNYANSWQDRYDALITAGTQRRNLDEGDWSHLAKELKGDPDVEPSLIADVQAKNLTDRVKMFVRAQVGKEALKAIYGTGRTDKLKVDWTNPVLVRFGRMREQDNAFLRSNPSLAAYMNIRSTEDKMVKLNQMAAWKVMTGVDRAANGVVDQGTPASMAPGEQQPTGPGLRPPQHSSVPGREAGAAAVRGAGGGSAGLQAGQRVNPTSQFGVPKEEPPHYGRT